MKTSSSQLKAKLGRYMRAVRAGKEVVITDRDEPVARLVPYRPVSDLAVRISAARDPGAPPLGSVAVRSIRPRGTDTTAMLRADRDRR